MLLEQFEKKHNDKHTTIDKWNVAIEVGEDKEDVRRLDALKISDYTLKLFRSKWAILEKTVFSYGQGEWYEY